MSAAGGDEYRRSFFDKYGPDAADRARVASWLIVPIVAGGGIGWALGVKYGFSAAIVILCSLVGSAVGAAWSWYFTMGLAQGAGKMFNSFVAPSGSSTPYERQYSYEDALVMRGNVEGALASYEKIIDQAPDEAQPRIRAAELYAKSEMRDRAETLYRAVQRLPSLAPKDDIFASHRLVDLYLAWPGHETKGLCELRRLIDTYPGTEIAERASSGLVNLKRQLGVTR